MVGPGTPVRAYPVMIPRRREMIATMLAVAPFSPVEPLRIVEIGCANGRLAVALLDTFNRATLLALEASGSIRQQAVHRTARFGDRIRVRAFDVAAHDWWD